MNLLKMSNLLSVLPLHPCQLALVRFMDQKRVTINAAEDNLCLRRNPDSNYT